MDDMPSYIVVDDVLAKTNKFFNHGTTTLQLQAKCLSCIEDHSSRPKMEAKFVDLVPLKLLLLVVRMPTGTCTELAYSSSFPVVRWLTAGFQTHPEISQWLDQ